jgi:hypothetical protein
MGKFDIFAAASFEYAVYSNLAVTDLPSCLTCSFCKQFWHCLTTASISLSIFYNIAISGFDASSDACFALAAGTFYKVSLAID